MSINGKKHSEIGVFLDSNLSFTIRFFIWGVANDLHICKKYKIPAKNVILIWFKKKCNIISACAVTIQKYYN